MKIKCPRPQCVRASNPSPTFNPIVRSGSYFRRSDSRRLPRYLCRLCKRTFSGATSSRLRYQKKRRINQDVYWLYDSGLSQRRLARYLGVNPKTIVRKIRFLALVEGEKQKRFLDETYRDRPLQFVQWDDLETAEHTKCKPLSVSLAIDPRTRKILSFQVARMPAKGHLSQIARKKYGTRPDERPVAWNQMMEELKPYVHPKSTWTSDQNPHYPALLKKHFPEAAHVRLPGARGCVRGQGELKKLRWDPMFSLNHTCAMLRANLNRLFRRTWCISKTKQGLIDHLTLYVSFHNQLLTPPVIHT